MRITLVVTFISGIIMSSISAESVFPGEEWGMASPESQGVDKAALQAALDHLESFTGSDGISQTLVVRHGRIIWQGEHVDSWHNVFSCTKSFLSMATGLLVEDGKIQPDAPLAKYYAKLSSLYPQTTAEHCLSLTSGYTSSNGSHPFVPAEPLYADGTAFHYNGEGLNLLAYVLSQVSGEPLDVLFKRRIADPIGMNRRWAWGDFGYVDGLRINNGSGGQFKGIHITARNLARVGLLLLNKGRWGDEQLLSADWIEKATQSQADADLPMHDPTGWYSVIRGAYGLGFWVNGIRPDGKRLWPDAPEGVFAIQGNLNNICLVIPEWDMLVVRLGTDERIDNDRYTELFAMLQDALLDK